MPLESENDLNPQDAVIEYIELSGLIDRLENYSRECRSAFARGDKRMFHVFAAQAAPLWGQVQERLTAFGKESLRATMAGSSAHTEMSNQLQDLTTRFTAYTQSLDSFMRQINADNPSFLQAPAPQQQKSGCYIATAVYGSYDAPEVLKLRDFRDQTLARFALGRGFIWVYYRVSPPIAHWLRGARTVNRGVRWVLDSLIRILR